MIIIVSFLKHTVTQWVMIARGMPCCTSVLRCYHNKIRKLSTISWLILSGKTVQSRGNSVKSHCHILGQYDFFSILPKWHFKNNLYLVLKNGEWTEKGSSFHWNNFFLGFFLSHWIWTVFISFGLICTLQLHGCILKIRLCCHQHNTYCH